jgi:CheY-like chemotaxis protein
MKTWLVLATAHRSSQALQTFATEWANHPPKEDLEQLALNKTLAQDRLRIESHLADCEDCRRGYEEAKISANRLTEMLRSQGRSDERASVRYRVRESAIVTLSSSAGSRSHIGQVTDVSARGLGIRVAHELFQGAQVQVKVEKAVVFGTVRHCRLIHRNTYAAGLTVDQVVIGAGAESARKMDAAIEHGRRAERERGAGETQPLDILLVEDNPADIRLLQFLLNDMHVPHSLHVVRDGAQALDHLSDPMITKPRLVVLDLNLPKVGGLEVLRRMRENVNMEAITVVILSGSSADTDVRRSTALGIHAYLSKPDNILAYEDLRHSLSSLVADVVH